jgi:ATP-dependent helicase HrpB
LLAAPVDAEALERVCASSIVEEEAVEWERDAQAVRARKKRRLGALILSEVPLMKPSAERTAQALVDGIRQEGDAILPWTAASARLRQRVQLMSRYASDWPDWSDEAWGGALERLLLPFIGGMKSRSDLQRLNLVAVLEAGLTWEQKQRLEQEAPTHMAVPSGSRIAIDYSDPQAPTLSVRLQELFGMTQTPLIAYGQVPLTIHLLSPAMRPVQITRDLASFWRDTYFEVKKDLKGRYPKHHWPDDPLAAKPTSRVKKPVK